MQWCIVSINLFIHILLYSYYGMTCMKLHVWWKKYLTLAQIIQFMIGLSACIGAMTIRTLYDFVDSKHQWAAPVNIQKNTTAYVFLCLVVICCFYVMSILLHALFMFLLFDVAYVHL